MKTITIKWLEPVIIPKQKHNILEITLVYFKALQKTVLFLIMGVAINTVSAQEVYSKLGKKPGKLNPSAVLELESTSRGFLPPRMEKTERDAISVSPEAVGLQVWCTNCNTSTKPPSGQLCVYLGKDAGWAPFTMLATSALTTAGNNDAVTADRPVRKSANSVTISGTLAEIFGSEPTETGIVWREISGGDFTTLPVLNDLGTAVAPNYNTPSNPAVTKANSPIKVTIPDLTSANPYYFRTYAKSLSGIGYGNAVIFNPAPPKISKPVIINENTLLPVFAGKLTVNAGTPKGTITEYGYCSGTTNPPTVANDKVVLSNANTIALLNSNLNSEIVTANPPAIDLAVNDYNVKTIATTYFRYYAVVNGETEPVYSDAVSFTPVADPVTGGTAIATLGTIEPISKPLKAGENSGSSFTVHFNVTKAGSYSFTPEASTGTTTGLSMNPMTGNFYAMPTDQTVTFTISGFPKTSLNGCSFVVPGIGRLNTGEIQQFDSTSIPGNVSDGNALCDATHTTAVVPVFSLKTGRIWMDRNLGASQAKTSTPADDYKAYGCLYQWGRGNDGHASINWRDNGNGTPPKNKSNILATSDTPGDSFILPDNVNVAPFDWSSTARDYLWQGINGKNNPCPGGYRVPTSAEFQAEIDATTLVSVLKVVRAPSRLEDNGIGFNYSLIWSSTISDLVDRTSRALYINLNMSMDISYNEKRFKSFSVRCIKN